MASDIIFQTSFSLPRSCEVSFDRHLVGSGWHESEGSDANAFRWMGLAECATIMLAIDRGVELVATLNIMMTISDACWSSFSFFVDGVQLLDEAVHVRHGVAELILPAVTDASTITELKICNTVRKVPAPDPRQLSVALSRVTISPRTDSLPAPTRLALRAQLLAYLEPLSTGDFDRLESPLTEN